jgi:hypothetical protein
MINAILLIVFVDSTYCQVWIPVGTAAAQIGDW